MKAITIKQPWLWCITDDTKRIENRTWKPPCELIGQRIALHASKASTRDEWKAAQGVCVSRVPVPGNDSRLTPLGAIVATAIIRGYVVVNDQGGVIEASKSAIHYEHRRDPWFFGPVGWLLVDVFKLPQPIPCKGKLGLWEVPAEIAAMMEGKVTA